MMIFCTVRGGTKLVWQKENLNLALEHWLTTGYIMSSCNHIFNNRACINLGFRVQACESLGPVDILINCAGFAVCGLFEETTVDQFKVNFHLFYCYSFFLTPVTEKCNLMKWHWKHEPTGQSGFSGDHLVGQSVGQSVSWSVSWSVSQSVGQSVSQSVCQLVSHLVSQSVSQSISQLVSQLVSQSIIHSPSQAVISCSYVNDK